MLTVAQKKIGGLQLGHCGLRQTAQGNAFIKHQKQFSLLQPQVATSANQLEALGDKLHLANTTVTQLYIVLQPPPAHLGVDHLLHPAQAFNDPEIHISAIDERA